MIQEANCVVLSYGVKPGPEVRIHKHLYELISVASRVCNLTDNNLFTAITTVASLWLVLTQDVVDAGHQSRIIPVTAISHIYAFSRTAHFATVLQHDAARLIAGSARC